MSWSGFIAVAALGLAFLGPIAGLLWQLDGTALSETLGAASFPKSLWITLISGAGGAAISLAIGALFARVFALHHWRARRIQRLALMIPYLVPNFILATSFVVAWNPGTGLLNRLLPFPGGLYGVWGMTLLFGIVHVPVAFLLLEEKFKRIDRSLREAARLSGASALEIFLRVDLPLLVPSIASAFCLCFALNISAFAIPAWIGAPERSYPLTFKIYQALQLGGIEGIPQAAALSLALLLVSIPILAISAWGARGEGRISLLTGKATREADSPLQGRGFWFFQALFWLAQLAFWILPLGALAASTLVPPGCLQDKGLACLATPSLAPYRYVLFELAETRMALKGSLLYGTLAAVLILALSLLTLVAFHRRPRERRITEWTFAVPLSTPGAILALGLIVTCSGRFGLNLYNTAWIAVVAFVLKHQNIAFQPLRTGLANISLSLTEAARLSGASSRETWQRIILPILRPECLGAFFFVLIPILGELTMSVFLTSPNFRTIGTLLFDLQDYSDQASAGALAILLVALVLALNEACRILTRGKLGY